MTLLVGAAAVVTILLFVWAIFRGTLAWTRRPRLVPKFDRDRCVVREGFRPDGSRPGWQMQVVRLAIENPGRRTAENVRVVLSRLVRCTDECGVDVVRPDIPFGVTHSQTLADEQRQHIPGESHGLVDIYWYHAGGGPQVEDRADLQVRPVPVNSGWCVLDHGARYRLDLRIDSTNARTRHRTAYVTVQFVELGGGVILEQHWAQRALARVTPTGRRA